MELIMVTSEQDKKDFLLVNVRINKANPYYIQPLDKDINDVFDPKKNKTFQSGECCRWILKDKAGNLIGRIAAFISKKYKNKGDEGKAGGMGFFDCINSQEAADMLFDVAKHWLIQRDMQHMDGPINFGERDRWWGLVTEGFHEPLYCMNFNQEYYPSLLLNYGFQPFYNQLCFSLKVGSRIQEKFYHRHAVCAADPKYSSSLFEKNNLDKYAKDFATVYNKAWAGHGGLKQMDERVVRKMFQTMKPVMDPNINIIIYYDNEPVALWVNLPDLNYWFKHLNGKFDLWHKLKFLWLKATKKNNKYVGLVFGIVPEFQGKGLESYMIVEGCKYVQRLKIVNGEYILGKPVYEDFEMQWIGEFNPKMVNVAKSLGTELTRKLTTFRYQFDRTLPFKPHPIV